MVDRAETERVDPGHALRPFGDQPRASKVSLLIYHGDEATLVPLRAGEPVVVGRGDDATITIDDPSLSRTHVRFRLLTEGQVEVTDLGSTNGTWLAAQRIETTVIGSEQEVTFGGAVASLHVLSLSGDDAREMEGHDRFQRTLARELDRARFFKRPAAVVMTRPLHDEGTPLRRWVAELQERMRPVDRLAAYSATTAEILLTEASLEQALLFARDLVSTIKPRLACGVALFPSSATSAEELSEVARRALRRATKASPVVVAEDEGTRLVTPDADAPVCESPAMKELFKTALRVAKSAIPVLLLAETGAGKEVLARYVHETSPRQSGPMVSVNCAAIPESLLESTLFGHEKGAFTGATGQRLGVFESASGGTVFLDEIGELPASAQAALLRVLEAKTITRVGSTEEISVDARVVAATHRDLPAMVQAGRFREDLLYRLNTMTLQIPPLRERKEDIPALAERFLAEANAANDRALREIAPDAMALLMEHAWPGNVRELKNAIERAVVIAEAEVVGVDDLPMSLAGAGAPKARPSTPAPAIDSGETEDFRTKMDRLEAEVLLDALRACGWNQTHAARRLQMPLRTLVHKIKVHGLRKLGYGKP